MKNTIENFGINFAVFWTHDNALITRLVALNWKCRLIRLLVGPKNNKVRPKKHTLRSCFPQLKVGNFLWKPHFWLKTTTRTVITHKGMIVLVCLLVSLYQILQISQAANSKIARSLWNCLKLICWKVLWFWNIDFNIARCCSNLLHLLW